MLENFINSECFITENQFKILCVLFFIVSNLVTKSWNITFHQIRFNFPIIWNLKVDKRHYIPIEYRIFLQLCNNLPDNLKVNL